MDQVEWLLDLSRPLDEVHGKVREVLIDISHLLRRFELVGNLQLAALFALDDPIVLAQVPESLQTFRVKHELRVFGEISCTAYIR
ncbi:hypothetical protein ACQ5SK_13010 [Bradyrhizobium japonicum]